MLPFPPTSSLLLSTLRVLSLVSRLMSPGRSLMEFVAMLRV